jgi:hypothetical protein
LVRDFLIAILLLCNAFTAYVVLEDRVPGVTFVTYSYTIRPGVREMEYCFWDKKLTHANNIGELVIDIKDKTKREAVIIHTWQVLRSK